MAAYISQPTRSRRFIKVYLATWALLAVAALAYLAVLAFQPSQSTAPRTQVAEPDPGQAMRAMAKATVEMGTMRRNLSDIQKDVSDLKDAAVQNEARDKSVNTRLTIVEERLANIDADNPRRQGKGRRQDAAQGTRWTSDCARHQCAGGNGGDYKQE